MNTKWEEVSAKVNALSQRERGILFATVVTVAAMVVYLPVLDPLLAKQKRLDLQMTEQRARTLEVQAQIAALESPGQADPNSAKRQRVEALKQEGTTLDQQLSALQQTLVPPGNMVGLLEDLLKRNGNLKLVSLATLPVSPLVKPEAEGSSAGPVPSAGSGQGDKPGGGGEAVPRFQVFKHGVEITVEGSYRDMLRYLAELEKLPWQMYWSEVKLKESGHPRNLMTFTVFTLSLDKTWLSL